MEGIEMVDPVVIKFSWMILAIPFSVALVGLVAALICFRVGRISLGFFASLVALVAGLFFAPAMLADVVTITKDRIEQRTGTPWNQTVKGFDLQDVDFVHITSRRLAGSEHLSEIWVVHYRQGGSDDIDPGDLWTSNRARIQSELTKRGVKFQ